MTFTAAAKNSEQNESASDQSQSIYREPLYFPCDDETIFAWLHTANVRRSSNAFGIVLCPPIGSEYMRSYRTVRHIADALAKKGHTVLRIDYQGTGNSSGHETDANRVSMWCSSIKSALDLLKTDFQCQHLGLVGMRVGANLAAIVSCEYPIDSLTMWAPIKKVNQYAREMQALSLVGREDHPPTPKSNGDLEVAGYLLQKQVVEDLIQHDLKTATLQCKHLLLVERDDLPANDKLHKQFESQGITVTSFVGEGYQSMMDEPHHCAVPLTAIQHLSDWHKTIATQQSEKEADIEQTDIKTLIGHLQQQRSITASLDRENSIEEAVIIPAARPLFGIFQTPSNPETKALSDRRPIVLLPNGGAVHQVGPNNLYLDLTQSIVNAGFSCFRFDLSGLGDSIISNMEEENTTYTPYALEDLATVIEYFKQKVEHSTFIVMGLCAGAYLSYQAAYRLPCHEHIESVMINPLTFYWKEGRTLSPLTEIENKEIDNKTFNYYQSAWKDFSKWQNFLMGRSKLSIVGAIRMILDRIRKKIEVLQKQKKIKNMATQTLNTADSLYGFGHSSEENLPYDLQSAIDSGKKLAFFFSRNDPGYGILKFHAGKKTKQLLKKKAMTIEFIDQADHTFMAFDSRKVLVDKITGYLNRNY